MNLKQIGVGIFKFLSELYLSEFILLRFDLKATFCAQFNSVLQMLTNFLPSLKDVRANLPSKLSKAAVRYNY